MRKTYKAGILSVLAASALTTASGQGVMQGSMHGGQQPISGARVYLLSPAQSTAPGTASVSLMTNGAGTDSIGVYVTTDSNGDFVVGPYNCPAANVPVYLYASGGNADYGSNPAISQAAYVSQCGAINSQTYVFMDEVTTVAMAYAVAGYATDPLHVSYSGTQASLTGIQNAFANANNLANSAQGTANSTIPSGGAMAPQATVNTLADALASCINQTSSAQNCSTLFSATNSNGVAPTDVATAAMNIAHNPASSTSSGIQNGTNIARIMTLSQAYQQFLPILASAPSDLTLGLTFSSSSIVYPTAVAIDGSGNAWIASQPLNSATSTGSVVEISNAFNMQVNDATYGIVYTPQSAEPDSIAVDSVSNYIWIGTDNAVEEFLSTTGVPSPGSPFLTNDSSFGGGYALNLDSAGNVWIGASSTVYELSSSGSVMSPVINGQGGYSVGPNAEPSALALDASNNVWITDLYNNALIELNSQGSIVNDIGPTSNPDPLNQPYGVAIDSTKDVWMANIGNNNNVEFSPTGSPSLMYFSPDVPPSSSYANPPTLTSVAIDGAGNSWYSLAGANCSSSSVCLGVAELSGANDKPLSGPGYSIDGNSMGNAFAVATAVDGSGDVWILNKYAQTVTELVGAAVPVVTPFASAVSTNTIGMRP